MASDVGNISAVQHDILACIKQQGEATNADIADKLGVSYEAVRQQLRQLEATQLVVSRKQRDGDQRAGRPTQVYALSATGDHLFPKAYDDLALALIDTLAAALGPQALQEVLASFTDDNVRQWAPHLQDKSLLERLEALKGIYLEDDAYMDVDKDETSGELSLVLRGAYRDGLGRYTIGDVADLDGAAVHRPVAEESGCICLVAAETPVRYRSWLSRIWQRLTRT